MEGSVVLLSVLSTGVAAGLVTFLLNQIPSLVSYKRKRQREALLLANELIDVALLCEEELGAHSNDSSVCDWENVPMPKMPSVKLSKSVDRYQALSSKTLAVLMDIDLEMAKFRWDAEDAEFEQAHFAENGFDLKAHRVEQLRSLQRRVLDVAIDLRKEAKGDTSLIENLREADECRD